MALCVFLVCCANWRVRHNNGKLLYGTKAGLVCELFGLNKKTSPVLKSWGSNL